MASLPYLQDAVHEAGVAQVVEATQPQRQAITWSVNRCCHGLLLVLLGGHHPDLQDHQTLALVLHALTFCKYLRR